MSQSTATAEQPVPHLQIRPSRGWSAINLREVLRCGDLLMVLTGIFTVFFGKTGQFVSGGASFYTIVFGAFSFRGMEWRFADGI